ncbi:hypothetical protein ACOSP7_022871 [Xanthoceras sorbifolium]|uniref:Protein N-lysine methyltransferase METTL21A n=1 Tax=Xanthoceras sorbifolium TaxID=99658 RepID=A0ABQ8HPX7_9ROSI|nr:hypothetical protein JRO89_XS08G0155000 [Xanthoceras sorbifolium]
MSIISTQEDDDDDIDPMKMISLHDDDDDDKQHDASSINEQFQRHYIRSIDSTVVIRQIPSEGLSFKLWPAATTLVTLLDHYRCHPCDSPLASVLSNGVQLSILELGSGTGLVGMAAAAVLGANVTVTDLPHVIPNLQFNVDANAVTLCLQGGTVNVAPLRWGEADDVEAIGREFDLIMGSDVVYHDHLFEPLLETLRLLLNSSTGEEKKKKTKFVVGHLRRWKKEAVFFKKAKKFFEVETIHVDRPCDGARIGVVVYCMTGKAKRS